MALSFSKMHGLGNNYVYIDLTQRAEEGLDLAGLSRRVSDVNFGIGSDGLIAILPGREGDFTMRMFNSDGSEAEMCGNGIRCVGKYVFDHGLTKSQRLGVDTGAGLRILELDVQGGRVARVRVDMGRPRLLRSEIPMNGSPDDQVVNEPFSVAGTTFNVTAVSMGNPHCVIFVDELSDELVKGIGPQIERHPAFPQRTNVEFVTAMQDGTLSMRVWERGSGETMACGTGACAVGVAASLLSGAEASGERRIVHLLGGDLEIEWSSGGSVFMTGPAVEVCQGSLTDEWLHDR